MKIGDEVFVHGYVDEIRKDTIIIKNNGGYFGTDEDEVIWKWRTQPPKGNGMYFVTTDKGGKRSVTMSGYRDEWIVEGVVAWMPIPEPCGGEE